MFNVRATYKILCILPTLCVYKSTALKNFVSVIKNDLYIWKMNDWIERL